MGYMRRRIIAIPNSLFIRRYQTEDTDGVDETDCGMEWPEHENPDVARYRSFYQVSHVILLLCLNIHLQISVEDTTLWEKTNTLVPKLEIET